MKKIIFLLILFSSFLSQPRVHGLNAESIQKKKFQEALQYEVVVTLKLIQVFVTDGKGNPVIDLEQSDFILYDNGKLKTITDFEKHLLIKHEKKVDEKTEAKPEKKVKEDVIETEPSPARKIASRMNRKFFLLLDIFQNDIVGMKKSKKAALHFIDTQVQPTDEVCVLSYSQDRGLILHEYLTTDFQKVQEAVKRVKGIPGKMIKREEEKEWVKMKTRQFTMEIKEFAKSLRYISGFKNIIFFSTGIPRSLLYDSLLDDATPEGAMGMTKNDPGVRVAYEDMCKELASSNSPVYTVNTKGARSLLDDLGADIETERGMRGDHSLQMLSDLSGGKYFADVEYYEKISEEIQNVTGNYYVLGYYIDEKWDGKYHEIKVKAKRKGCRVYAQGGYFNPKPFTEFSEFERQLHLFDLALSEKPYFQEPLYFSSIALPCSEKKESNIVLLSEITVDRIEEVVKEKTEVLVLIFDKDNNIVESRRTEIHFSTIPENTIYHYIIASLDPGEYECRAVIRNLKTGKGAVGSSSAVIPEPLDSGIKLYPPLLLIPDRKAYYLKFSRDQKDKSESESLSLNEIYPFVSNKHSPLVEGVDRGTNRVWAVVKYSFLGIQQPDIKLSANLIHHLADTDRTIPVAISIINRYHEDDTEIFLIELQTEELQLGEYSLYLFAEDSLTQSSSDVHTTFKVK